MKNFIKLFVVVVVMAFVFISCEKGGTIEVTNSLTTPTYVNVYKGDKNLLSTIGDSVKEGEGTLIKAGGSHTFSVDEDGSYIVTAIPPLTIFKEFILLVAGGSTHTVTVK